MKVNILLIALLWGGYLFPFGSVVEASPATEFYSRQAIERYFPLPIDARTLAMGGSTGATCSSSACIYMNPAGLARVPKLETNSAIGWGEISGSEFPVEQDIEQSAWNGYSTLAIPLGGQRGDFSRYGSLAFGYSRYQGETDDTISSTPDGHRRSIGYGYAPLETLSFGYSYTFYDDQLKTDLGDLHSHARNLHLFGLQHQPTTALALGTLFQLGIGQSDTFQNSTLSDGLSRPRQYTSISGAEYQFEQTRAALSFEYSYFDSDGNLSPVSTPVVFGSDEDGSRYQIGVGIEHQLNEQFQIRGGLKYFWVEYDFERDELSSLSGQYSGTGWSAGLGYLVAPHLFSDDGKGGVNLKLDYGVEYTDIASDAWQHLLSVTISEA